MNYAKYFLLTFFMGNLFTLSAMGSGNNNSDVATGASVKNSTIKGNGILKKEERTLAKFENIKTDGVFEVYIVCQEKNSKCSIQTDSNLLEYINTSVENDTLNLTVTKNIETKSLIKIYIYMNNLNKLVFSGSSEIKVTKVNNEKLDLNVEGSGSLSVAGTSSNMSLIMNGSSDINLKDLKTENAKVELGGSGTIIVCASKSLNASISGAGEIIYYGNPTISKNITGAGEVLSATEYQQNNNW